MDGVRAAAEGRLGRDVLAALEESALREPIRRFERTGSPVVTDGEQKKPKSDIRGCLAGGAHVVPIDLTEGRLAVKLDPSKGLLRSFVDLVNRVLARFPPEQRRRVLAAVRDAARPEQRSFVGVTDPIGPRIESPEEVRDRVLEAAEVIPPTPEALEDPPASRASGACPRPSRRRAIGGASPASAPGGRRGR